MVAVMEQLTDRPEWHVDTFDDKVVAAWRKEIIATNPLISEMAWTWCVKELRDKAADFRENQHVRVLDTGTCVCKSDTADLGALAEASQQSVPSILEQQQDCGRLDWRSNQVLSLVGPSLFPLVYWGSPVLMDGGKVDLRNILNSQPSAAASPKHFDRREDSDGFQKEIDEASKARDLSRGLYPSIAYGRKITPGSIAGAQIINFFRARWNFSANPEPTSRVPHTLTICIRCIRGLIRPSKNLCPWQSRR
jgi:hypothetical protein